MLKFNYKLVQNQGDEQVVFQPEGIPKKLDSLSYIEGPNGSGKSTLLNIIALGFFALKKRGINPALEDKVRDLAHSKDQALTFDIEITSKDGKVKLISEKADPDKPDIKVTEVVNDKVRVLSRETFESEYNLIYDIPDNPTQRLNQLIKDVEEAQIRYGYKVGSLKDSVRRIVSEIQNSRDPERIKVLQEQISTDSDQLDLDKKMLAKKEAGLDILECYVYLRFYIMYKESYDSLRDSYDKLEKQSSRAVRRVDKTKALFDANLDAARKQIVQMNGIFEEARSALKVVLPKDKKGLLSLWESVDFDQALKEMELDADFRESLVEFMKILSDMGKELDQSDSLQEVNLYDALIKILENHRNLTTQIPGLNVTLKQLVDVLREARDKDRKILELKNNIVRADQAVDQLMARVRLFCEETLPKLRVLKGAKAITREEVVDAELEEEKRKIASEMIQVQAKLEDYERKNAAKGPDSKDKVLANIKGCLGVYCNRSESELRDNISGLKNDVVQARADVKTLEQRVHHLSMELENVQSKKPHRYQNEIDLLNDILKKVQTLETKIKINYKKYIQAINDKDSSNISQEQEKYNDAIFSFLGHKVGRFRHGNKEHVAVKINYIEGKIYTDKKGKTISLSHMGTGQTQSAYLKGLLKTHDKRKIIAMFDEVAMMDGLSLAPIYETFRELYNSGKLILGIVVQRGDSVNVLSKES